MAEVATAMVPISPLIFVEVPEFVIPALPPEVPNVAAAPRATAPGESSFSVVKVQTKLLARALPAGFLAPVVIVAV
jgi:hypothetical protein